MYYIMRLYHVIECIVGHSYQYLCEFTLCNHRVISISFQNSEILKQFCYLLYIQIVDIKINKKAKAPSQSIGGRRMD